MAMRLTFVAMLLLAPLAVSAATELEQSSSPPRPSKPFFLRFYTPPTRRIEAKVPQYTLPLTPDDVVNWKEASRHFKSKNTADLILKNGFAVESGWGERLGFISEVYDNLPEGVPMFVTVDSALHIQHVLYDQLFLEIETTFMVKDLDAITAQALAWFDNAYSEQQRRPGVSPKKSAAARRTLAYFAVGARLLDPRTTIPGVVKKEVATELANIEKGTIAYSPLFIYGMDYSQYTPRGHYTRSEGLERYFRAMMWYAQGAFLFQGGTDMIVDAGTADIQTIQAIEIARFFVENAKAYEQWHRMQAVLEFFAGTMDDVSVADVIRIKEALDAELATAEMHLGEAAYLTRMREKLLKLPGPKIHAATGLPEREASTPERKKRWLEQARGMRVFGQRFSLDGYAMSTLVGFTYMGGGRPFTRAASTLGAVRGYPSPLDVMALLGSARAEVILREAGDAAYANYERELGRLKKEFGALTDADWHSNLARCRLHHIRMLLEPVPEGYPTAMQTMAWNDRRLSSGLSAWAQLKHDMILAQKQPADAFEGLPGPSSDVVEPVPFIYAELLATNRAVLRGLGMLYPELVTRPGIRARIVNAALGTLGIAPMEMPEEDERPPYIGPLVMFNRWLGQLVPVSAKELRNEAFDERDRLFLGSIGHEVMLMMSGVEPQSENPAVVADVFTNPNEGQVLEVATGHFNLLWVVYRLPDGKKVLGAGPVMSYYEFKQPMAARLTDEEWRERLKTNEAPDVPAWTKTFLCAPTED